MLIAVDIDDVLGELAQSFLDFHNSAEGTHIKFDDLTSFKFWEIGKVNLSKEEVMKRFDAFFRSHPFIEMATLPGSVEAVKSLKESHKLIVITGRPEEVKKETEHWINKNFPGMFDEILFTNHYSKNFERTHKSDVCISRNVDLIIDDSFEFVERLADSRTDVILMDKPWNQGIDLPENFTRVKSWLDIPVLVEIIADRRSAAR